MKQHDADHRPERQDVRLCRQADREGCRIEENPIGTVFSAHYLTFIIDVSRVYSFNSLNDVRKSYAVLTLFSHISGSYLYLRTLEQKAAVSLQILNLLYALTNPPSHSTCQRI